MLANSLTCPACNANMGNITMKVDGTTYEGDPKPGDVTICYFCDAGLVFGEDGGLRPLSAWEENIMPVKDRRELAKIRGVFRKLRYRSS